VASRTFPDMGHGQVFSASLGPAIRAFGAEATCRASGRTGKGRRG